MDTVPVSDVIDLLHQVMVCVGRMEHREHSRCHRCEIGSLVEAQIATLTAALHEETRPDPPVDLGPLRRRVTIS